MNGKWQAKTWFKAYRKAIIAFVATVAIIQVGTWVLVRSLETALGAQISYSSDAIDEMFRSNNDLLIRMKGSDDPAFDKNGFLLDSYKGLRCQSSRVAADAFEKKWVDVRFYKGRQVRDHSIAVEVLMMGQTIEYKQGCLKLIELESAASKYRRVEAADLALTQLSDIPWHVPVGTVGSMAQVSRFRYDEILGRTLNESICEADQEKRGMKPSAAQESCDGQAYGSSKPG